MAFFHWLLFRLVSLCRVRSIAKVTKRTDHGIARRLPAAGRSSASL